jgi:hypothetical protein
MSTRRAVAASALLVSVVVSVVACGDNMHPGESTLLISPQSGLFTDEAGATATVTIALTAAPASDVAIRLTSNDLDEGTVSPATLVFTKENYARAQTVTITGVDDKRADGDRPYTVRIGTDLLGSFELDVVNGDNDSAGVTVTPLVGLMTTEAGAQATFTIALTSEPFANVLVPLSSSDTTEGTVSSPSITFSPANWDVPQTVTVSGAQDTVNDGSVAYAVMLGTLNSADLNYDELDPDDVQVLNVDDDVFGIAVTPGTALVTTEAGAADTFQVVLQTQPTASVTIGVSSTATTEVTLSTTQLMFTTSNWNTPQTVTITGKDDAIDDDDQPFTIVLAPAVSADTSYAAVDPPDVTGTNSDDDSVGITVTPTAALVTTEAGGSDSFSVVLTSQPTAPLTIAVSSSDTTEGMPAQTLLTFTTANWMTVQTVTVNGQNDTLTDGNVAYTVQLANPTTTDAKYAAINPADVSLTNQDNDIPGFTFDPDAGLIVSEFLDSDPVGVTLNTQPTANVTITFSSSDTTEGTVSPASLTFTPANWNVAQFVNVTGVNDTVADGNISFFLVTGTSSSTDAAYNGINPPDIDVVNIDNDTAQVYVKARKRMFVSEAGGSTTFRVRLTVAPTATVTCTLQSTDTTEGTVSPTTLTFQPNNFGFRTVTITGVDDMVNDGDVSFTVVLNACTSTDLAYQGSNPRDVAATNRDND